MIVRLDEDGVRKDGREVPVNKRPQLGELLRRQLVQRTIGMPPIPLCCRLTEAEIADFVDIDRLLRVPEQIVQETSHPRVSRLGIRREPYQSAHVSSSQPVPPFSYVLSKRPGKTKRAGFRPLSVTSIDVPIVATIRTRPTAPDRPTWSRRIRQHRSRHRTSAGRDPHRRRSRDCNRHPSARFRSQPSNPAC